MKNTNLARIRVVLVGITHPGNIGAAARAMKSMGLSQLALVAPKTFPSAEATARASGADDILIAARVSETLPEALEGCSLVIGASARERSLAWPIVDPEQAAAQLLTEAANGDVALVFGREHAGLTNDELDRCHYLLRIPVNPDFSSLNVASAVQVVAYAIGRIAMNDTAASAADDTDPADIAQAEDMERFYRHLEQALLDIGFLSPDRPKKLRRRLYRMFNRMRPDKPELQILRGILTAAQKLAGKTSSG